MYGAVPPDTVKLAAPVELPKQRTFVPVILALKPEAGCVIVTLAVVEQPLASVTVTEKLPVVETVIVAVVWLLDHTLPVAALEERSTEPPVQKEVEPAAVTTASVTETLLLTPVIWLRATASPMLFEKSELLDQVKGEEPKARKRKRTTVV